MSKLGVIVTRASGGLQELYSRNKEGWEKYSSSDLRTLLGALSGFADGTGVVTYVRFVRPGTAFTVSKSIPGRGGDFTSATLFVPARADVPAGKLADIIGALRAGISAPYLDTASLEGLFAEEYPDKAFSNSILSRGDTAACRYYGGDTGYTLEGLLEEPFQKVYEKYSGVFFIDRSSGIVASSSLADLTGTPLESLKGKVRIGYSDFEVTDSGTGGLLGGFRVFLNGVEVPRGSSALVSERGAGSVQVRVTCKGYVPYERVRTLSRPVKLSLDPREEPAEVPPRESRPVRSKASGLLERKYSVPAAAGLAGLILGFLLGMMVFRQGSDDGRQETTPAEPSEAVVQSDSLAVDSLAVTPAEVQPAGNAQAVGTKSGKVSRPKAPAVKDDTEPVSGQIAPETPPQQGTTAED